MKKKFLNTMYAAAIAAVVTLPSCNTDALLELNKNPDQIEYIIPAYSFTSLVLGNNPATNYGALAQGLQYFTTYKEVPAVGDKFYAMAGGGGGGPYTGQLNRIRTLIEQIPGAENVNKRAAAIIIRVMALHNFTDVVGDIPYSEAEKGLENLKPKYDTQKEVYLGLLAELDAALTSMDATKLNVFGTADPYFQGDVAKWKKFGYTLMLRMGMRMSEVDPALSKTWVQKAIAGGVMSATGDIAYQKYANVTGQMNGVTGSLQSGNYAAPGGDNVEGGKYTQRFIDHLKATKDPRLSVIAVVWKPAGGSNYTADTLMANQIGMKEGAVNSKPGNFDIYSEPSLLYLDRGAPILVLTPAEAYLLLAEASIRGWYPGSNPKDLYNLAVTRGMQQWALWPAVAPHSGVISQAKIDSYLLNGYPFKTTGTFEQQLEQIMIQKWVTLLGNDYEMWSEWRRTKYPKFNYKNWRGTNGTGTPSFYPGNVTGGKMWRRFQIANELATNKDNYLAALARQGFPEMATGDLLQGRMWWDTPARGDGDIP
jgi:hypothetical protein